MSYREDQRKKAVKSRASLFRDPGSGIFYRKERDFVLKDPSLNLWDGIREDALAYFKANKIKWWMGQGEDPTGHLLSSQVACLNHLYFARQRQDVATALLKRLDPSIKEALTVTSGFVEFEYIGSKQLLKEKAFTRGANCTSIDAVMLGITTSGKRILFLIEWKYTENYEVENLYVPERAKVYDELIKKADSPFAPGINPQSFYYEPFYQMMRQTLLGGLFESTRELGCDQCLNVHVIPKDNKELTLNITSPTLRGRDIHTTWKSLLKVPDKYLVIDPVMLCAEAAKLGDAKSWSSYLNKRYGDRL